MLARRSCEFRVVYDPRAEDGGTSEAGTHSLWMSHLVTKIERQENAAINWIEGHSTIIIAAVFCTSLAINFALAGLALYELTKHLAGRLAGLLAAILFLLNPDIFRWNLFVFTDALYIYFVILACWAIWKASGNLLTKTLSFAVVLFASSIRPNGWPLPLIAV